MLDKKVIGICFGDHIYSFELWGCNFFLLLVLVLLLLFVGIIKLHILLILSILLQFCVISLLNSVMDHKFCED
jgi:predicted branched-subunit amino acid permease